MEKVRLQKYMANAGVASRRKCEELILAGEVTVNGQVVQELGFRVEPELDCIEVSGRRIQTNEEKVYILLNKPKGVLSSVTDDRGRQTVVDLVQQKVRVYPVGRLDYDTEGLLLLTNDGELTNLLIHPRFKVDKTYLALVRGLPDAEVLEGLRRGIDLEDGLTHPAEVKLIREAQANSLIEITIHEGRNRQVRRMFEAVGHRVIRLKRVKFAFLELGKLKPGEYRFLSPREVQQLYNLISIPLA